MSAKLLLPLLALAATAAAPVPPPSGNDEANRAAWVSTCADWDEWDKAGPPFHIFGNTWYVGTCGISAILITGNQGHIVIDGASSDETGEQIAANIATLGFQLKDVKYLLHSHEHGDHAGGLARLQQLTGAQLLASPEAAPVLRTGKASAEDPQAASGHNFPPARVDGLVTGGQIVRLGDLSLIATATPGHTPGAMSWQWVSCEAVDCQTIVYADSLTPVSSDDYRFSDHPLYLAAYRDSLMRVAGLKCTILLTPHPSASGMRDRLAKGSLIEDSGACSKYAKGLSAQLDERLAKEQAAKAQ